MRIKHFIRAAQQITITAGAVKTLTFRHRRDSTDDVKDEQKKCFQIRSEMSTNFDGTLRSM